MSLSSSLESTARAFMQCFNTLNPDDHLALRTPDCTHIFAPASLGPPAPKSNTEFAEHLSKIQPILAAFPVTAREIHVNEASRQVVIWATAKPHFRDEVKGRDFVADEWDFSGEYVFILDFEETGTRIERVVEFLDSKATEEIIEAFGKAFANILANSG